MTDGIGRIGRVGSAILVIAVLTVSSCRRSSESRVVQSPAVLRVGVAQLTQNPNQGLRQLAGLLSLEGLARPGENGRLQPWLAEKWTVAQNGRSLLIALRPNVKFHDGSPADAFAIAALLPDSLRSLMGPVFSDVDSVKALSPTTLEVSFKEPSPFLQEGLEATILKRGASVLSTGPYAVDSNSTTQMRASNDYYLGRPQIDLIQVATYPSVRSAWADMLRDRVDMLWEVGSEALDSMKNSSTVSVFTYTRHYQHVIVFNQHTPALHSAAVRRALNFAIDRKALVHNALRDHGVASSTVVPPQHWAIDPKAQRFDFDPQRAANLLGARGNKPSLQFTCLVAPDSVDERIALDVKQQLAMVGVDMAVQESSRDEIIRRGGKGEFEAAVSDAISGPTMLRPYLFWHSNSPVNWGNFGSTVIDTAFDRVRHAPDEERYRDSIRDLQQAFFDDPPAIFLAWSVRARAINKRFLVPAEEGRDVLSTIRLWTPTGAARQASRN